MHSQATLQLYVAAVRQHNMRGCALQIPAEVLTPNAELSSVIHGGMWFQNGPILQQPSVTETCKKSIFVLKTCMVEVLHSPTILDLHLYGPTQQYND